MYEKQYINLFKAYNVRSAAITITYAINNNSVFVRMAKTLDPNVKLIGGKIQKGDNLFDWGNAINFKLEPVEIAGLAKLEQPFYLKNWEDKTMFHQYEGTTTVFSVTQNKRLIENGELAVCLNLSTEKNKVKTSAFLPLNGDQTYLLAKAMTIALNKQGTIIVESKKQTYDTIDTTDTTDTRPEPIIKEQTKQNASDIMNEF